MNAITDNYNGTTITYDEPENLWRFTLRGRDRSASSLVQAKEAIDKPVSEKTKPFEKISAWWFRYSDMPQKIEITGIAEGRSSRDQYVWIKSDSGRSKESVGFSIYPSDAKNDAIAEAVIARMNEISELHKEIDKSKLKLNPLYIPKED